MDLLRVWLFSGVLLDVIVGTLLSLLSVSVGARYGRGGIRFRRGRVCSIVPGLGSFQTMIVGGWCSRTGVDSDGMLS
jgi:hypothetical protein